MKLISWNVNGIRACVQKGFLDFFQEADADIFCIQAKVTKINHNQKRKSVRKSQKLSIQNIFLSVY